MLQQGSLTYQGAGLPLAEFAHRAVDRLRALLPRLSRPHTSAAVPVRLDFPRDEPPLLALAQQRGARGIARHFVRPLRITGHRVGDEVAFTHLFCFCEAHERLHVIALDSVTWAADGSSQRELPDLAGWLLSQSGLRCVPC